MREYLINVYGSSRTKITYLKELITIIFTRLTFSKESFLRMEHKVAYCLRPSKATNITFRYLEKILILKFIKKKMVPLELDQILVIISSHKRVPRYSLSFVLLQMV